MNLYEIVEDCLQYIIFGNAVLTEFQIQMLTLVTIMLSFGLTFLAFKFILKLLNLL